MYLVVNKNQELSDLVEEVTNSNDQWITIDTEFDRRNTYYPILSLIQIATHHRVWIIDALSGVDIKILNKLFENEGIVKIFHAGEQDWHILKKECGVNTYPIMDIQIMAVFASYGVSLSLVNLAAQFIYKNIDKTSQDSNWLERPLTDQQLEYAALDAKYIAQIYPILKEKLEKLGRLKWVEEEMKILFKKYSSGDDSKNWTKYCSRKAKWPIPLYAYYLVNWRNDLAKKLNKPKQSIISNQSLKNLIEYQKIHKYKSIQCPEGSYEEFLDAWHQIKKNLKNKIMRSNLRKILLDIYFNVPRNRHERTQIINTGIDQLSNELSIPKNFIINREDLIQALETHGESLNSWRRDLLLPIFKEAQVQEELQKNELKNKQIEYKQPESEKPI